MALPVTSDSLVVDLSPVASHDTSPLDTLGDAELNKLLCAYETYSSSELPKYNRTRHVFSASPAVCAYR